MNYTEIKSLALGYADRSDTATVNNVDNFLKIVEARVNKKLKTQKMGTESSIVVVADQLKYDLPSDFAGLREIVVTDGTSKKTGHLVTPERMTSMQDDPSESVNPNNEGFYYLIIADQLKIYPAQEDTASIDLVYYKHVAPLTSTEANNWLATNHPDCYVFGLVVEISAFVKDADAKALWDSRFIESMFDIHTDDAKSRW
ncbi:MAG: hypothetical protein KAT90_01460, partial [Gammaproteobacteria bacterium]|nr:hypothetical protein [Gammaproteobacteria bacterium]